MTRPLAMLFVVILFLLTVTALVTVSQGMNPDVHYQTSNQGQTAPSTADYREALDNLYNYLVENVGIPPNARSQDWGVYHEYHAISHGAMVTGATTSESMGLAFVLGALYHDLTGDRALMTGTLGYIRGYMMPHDGITTPVLPDGQHTGPYQPCLVHWLVDVDGGALMGDTGTSVGPNTAYLPYEHHEGESPVDPDPDREAYISPDNYKYASAPDADQWLAVGLWLAGESTEEQAYKDLARCIIASLEDGLTGPEDFRIGIVDDFEQGDLASWWQYVGPDTTFLTGTVSPGASGTKQAMRITYTVPWAGYAGVGQTIQQDWSGSGGIRFWFLGEGLGNQIRVQLTDPAQDACPEALGQEYFEYLITDTLTGWQEIEIPFSEFQERTDWPPCHADTGNNVLDLPQIQSFALEPIKGSFQEDFENGNAGSWWSYAVDGASIVSETISPGADQTNMALQITYDVAAGQAGVGISPSDDWSCLDSITVYISGTNSGNDIRLELVEQGDERWKHVISDTFLGWQAFPIPLEMSEAGFVKRYWQPSGAVENGILDLDSIKDIIFSPLPGWFGDDFEDDNVDDWWTYAGGDAAITRTVVGDGANGTTRAMRIAYNVPSGGWAGTGKTVGQDWTNYNGVQLWARGTADAPLLLLEDADQEWFQYQLALSSAWTLYTIPFSSFVYRPENSNPDGNQILDLDWIRTFIIQPWSPGSGVFDVDELTVIGTSLGMGRFALDELHLSGPCVRSGSGVATFDEIELTGGPQYQKYPGVMKFSLQWDQNGQDPWTGPLYSGYQDPTPYYLIGQEITASRVVTFLAEAQGSYDAIDPAASNLGPFMPIFVQDPQYSWIHETGWTWDGRAADENTHWAQFQYRTFAHLAQYYHRSGDAKARVVLDNFYDWLTEEAHWQVGATGAVSIPITMITGTEQVELGYRPGDLALAAQGLIYLAASTREAQYKADAEILLNTLLLHQDGAGAFPNNDAGLRFGFEQAEVGIALSLYELLLTEDRFECYLPLVSRTR